MRALSFCAACLLLALATGCKETVRITPGVDAGPLCGENERLVNGECQFVCDRDGDCAAGERCNLFTGRCEPKPPEPDAGPRLVPCTEGGQRCSADTTAIERCQADGGWAVETACPAPDGFCQNEQCLACRPGTHRCQAGGAPVLEICEDDGSGFRQVTCAGMATCTLNECRECAPDQKRCSANGQNLEVCTRLPREDLSYGWVPSGDNFDGTCITQVCENGTNGPQCRAPACVPGATSCLNTTTQQTCTTTGSWMSQPCAGLPGMGPNAECQSGVCVDECADAVAAKSYYGCEYWSAVLDNSMDALFKGNTASGQGTADSDFVFVVTNQSISPAQVEVWRYTGSAPVRIKNVTVPGRNDTATKGLMKIPVPWQSITPANALTGTANTGRARYAYKITSTRPITVYQFNPVDAVKVTKACSGTAGQADCGCDEYSDFDSFSCLFGLGGSPGVCANTATGKRCTYGTFSNDASLLLPAHDLGTSHVMLAPDHTHISDPPDQYVRSAQMVIVATQDNTTVTVKSTADTIAGGGITAMTPGSTRAFTMQSYEVLQLSSASTGTDLQCYGTGYSWCRKSNDLTGSVITSDKPVAVFTSHPCENVPYDRPYCDHVEEQIFPFATWGKNFVAVPSHPLRLNNNGFATNPPPDHFKIVAACPASQCPMGTTITLSTPPSAANILAPNNCVSGTSLTANNCRLMGGAFVQFKSTSPFTVTADQPIAIAQFLPGQGQVTGLSTDPQQGDPSMILLPPVEQWRSRYTVLASTGLKDNYLALALDTSKVQSVAVDGVNINLTPGTAPSDAKQVTGTTFLVKNHPVTTGTHTISVTPKAGQMVLPGAGVTVYGYDAQVSYGYTGGLDLGTIVTGINPGG